jgi:predicted DNA-binding transcriptional regulator AlpA
VRHKLLPTAAFPPPHDERSGGGDPHTSDFPLTARQSAAQVGLSLPAFWRGVGAGRLPKPIYPAPRAPRWFSSELRAALEATRATPAEAKAARRAARLARQRST